ncbi:hemagglutinin repeat-containing protein [Faucicola mancuniensis]|uniref:hemagglutinin repeat-containing protein n=1 Tax=Faucicola mancuniensis TaxID=1309795 RepID=UPI003977677C
MGVYADTKGSAGISANANMAKAYGNGETTTNANSHINVAGTTYQNVGGDYVVDGAVEKGNRMTGHIGGAIKATSRQDTATYDGKQTNAGFSADIDLVKQGAGSSLSINGGRTRANADYAAVTEQTGLQYQSSDVVVEGKSTFKGAYFTTATPEANKTQFKGGLEVSDIENHSEYKADGINAGLSAETGQKPKISGVGYGKDGDSQTSTTYGAVTGVAGKSDVTTANVGSLNEVLQNNFDKDRVNEQINAQVQISQEYGKGIPKAIGDYASNKQLELINQGNIEEAKKWGEGGIYRVALHTLSSALATGSIEGAVAGSGTAIVVPKVDEYLKQQGYDEATREAVLVGLSAGIGGAVGDTASTANNVGQVEWNYLTHRQLQEKISCVGTKKDCAAHVAKYDEISRQQDEQLKNICSSNPNSTSCHLMMQDALEYVGKNRSHYGKASDIRTSTQNVLSVANSSGYHTINTLNERANYFGAMYGYTDQPWFRVAESESRSFLSLKGADKSFYSDWIAEAGGVIMRNGRSEFQYIYNNHVGQSNSWSYGRLVNEQHDRELQAVHERHYNSWKKASKFFVDSAIKLRRRSKSGDF